MTNMIGTAGVSAKNEPSASDGALVLDGISAGYGGAAVLRDVSIVVPGSGVTALLGANGAGKTTLLRVASGLLRPASGTVRLGDRDVTGRAPWQRLRDGLCLVPEGRGIFPSLTVRENLELQVPPWAKDHDLDRAVEAFPALGTRMKQVAGTLSGGQQQMLALARAVLAEPKVLLLDEISMGLAPLLVDQLFESLAVLAEGGTAMLIVEQYVHRALDMSSLVYVLQKGSVVFSGPPESLRRNALIDTYLGA
jgi:branched-chain amino acid transport system ATP-binding protein